jgi:hypothetical protein
MIPLYLDPGSGSFLLQLLVAALAGAGVAIGANWAKIKRFFAKRKKTAEINDDDEEDDEPTTSA